MFESHGVDLKDPDAPAAYKVYELVRGVRVTGRAAPGSTIDVSISLKTNRNRVFKYETLSRANAAGRYEVRLPYSNREGPQAVRPTKRYRFTCGAESRYLSVAERDVQQGRSLRGPALCAQRS